MLIELTDIIIFENKWMCGVKSGTVTVLFCPNTSSVFLRQYLPPVLQAPTSLNYHRRHINLVTETVASVCLFPHKIFGGKSRNKGRASRAAVRGAKVTIIIGNMVLVSSGFHKQKNFSENIRNLGLRPQKFCQPCPRPKNFKAYWLEGAPNY
jgi:hypothetical protein